MTRVFAAAFAAIAMAAAGAQAQPQEIGWEDLMPPGEEELLDELYEEFFAELEQRIASSEPRSLMDMALDPTGPLDMIEEGGEFDQMVQIGTFNVVEELDGRHVRIPTYLAVFDFSATDQYDEFLLVPYFGACIHVPPPPPNQIIHVKLDAPITIDDVWAPFWAEGVLRTERHENDLGDAAYRLELTRLDPYEWAD